MTTPATNQDQNLTITAGGVAPNPAAGVDHFDINDAAGPPVGFFLTRVDANYYVTASLAGVLDIIGIDIVSQTVSGFTAQLTAPLTNGDVLTFHIFDPRQAGTITIGASAFAIDAGSGATLSDGAWAFPTGDCTVAAPIPLPVGAKVLRLRFNYNRGSSGAGTHIMYPFTGWSPDLSTLA